VKYIAPAHDRNAVNKAGRQLINNVPGSPDSDWALSVVNNWRAAHNFPLNSFHVVLRARARVIDPNVVTAQRLKRLPSINGKLSREPLMKLSQMQDIGGCRAILRGVGAVRRLVRAYQLSGAKNPKSRAEFIHAKDYIAQPKADGYRSYHLIYRYRSDSPKHCFWNDLKIEIQLRSRLQHAWATAVEMVSTFTGHALKWSGGDADWRRFFALMASALAIREHTPLVPGTPTAPEELTREIRALATALRVEPVLMSWSAVTREIDTKHASAFLLVLHPLRFSVDITGFGSADLTKASDEYLKAEKLIANEAGAQAVLVFGDSVKALRKAYPNYFLDTRAFIEAVKVAIR
jgi:hypothetical protein